jgi:iron complex outermembrane receptor protein
MMKSGLYMTSLAALAAALATPAMAQDSEESGASASDIIVTARRRDERLLDVPLAVTAISGDTLAQKKIDNVEALRFVAPSLMVSAGSFGKAVPGYTLRGQRSLESILTQDTSVGIYFAEVVQQRPHGTNSAIFDLASVEVLKGPQGTLFGRNTTGGAILFNPNKPTFETEGMVQLEGGNYDLKRGTAVINIPLSDTLAIRAAGRITRRDGFVRHLIGADYTNPFQNSIRTGLGFKSVTGSKAGYRSDDERTEAARLSLLWKPSDIFTSYFVGSYFHQDDHGTGFAIGALNKAVGFGLNPVVAESYDRQQARSKFWTTEANFHPAQKAKVWGISNTSTLELGGITLKNIFGYRKLNVAGVYDFDASPAIAFESGNGLKSNQWSEEFQVSGDISDRVNFITGLYWFRESGRDTQYSILFGTRANDGIAKNESSSAYAQFGAKLTDQLTLTVGGRYTVDDRKLFALNKLNGNCRIVDSAGLPLDPCFKAFDKSFKSPSWLVSLDYKPNDDMLVYLSHRRGYRAGGWNLRANRSTEQISFKPENVYDIEAGFKAQLFDGKFSVNGAVYQQWYKDIQRTVSFIPAPGQALATVQLNAASAKVRGGELEVTARPIEFLELGGTVSHVDARYSKFLTPAGADFSNANFAQAPRWTYTLSGRIFLPTGGDVGEVSLGANYFHQSSMWMTDLNVQTINGVDTAVDVPTPGYGVLDVSLDWKQVSGMPLDLSVYAKNVTNKEYYTGGSSVYSSLGETFVAFGAPRQIGASLTWRFGGSANR